MTTTRIRNLVSLILFTASVSSAQLYQAEPYVSNLNIPVRFAFAPDGSGRIFYCELLTGAVRVIDPDSASIGTWLTVPSSMQLKQGLLGIVCDPRFAANHYIYLFYTTGLDTPSNVVERYTEVDLRADTSSRLRLFEQSISTPCGSGVTHNGGALAFGKDGKLYISLGDNGCPELAHDSTDARGKIIRIEPDVPAPFNAVPTNPWYDDGDPMTGADDRVYAKGLRNPFGLTLNPSDSTIYATENGPDCNDKVLRIVRGGDYGWRTDCDTGATHCNCPQDSIIKPLLRLTPVITPTGLVFYHGTLYPDLDGSCLFLDYLHTRIHAGDSLSADSLSDRIICSPAVTELFDIHVGPDGYIYFAHDSGIERLVPQSMAVHPRRTEGATHLLQNSPNPFNPSTTIGYTLERREHVTLHVINTLGEVVATLVNETLEPGRHSVRFDGQGLASGVYFYRLTTADRTETRKLILLR
jgi:glucose/arabinose dehydrogenase